MQGRSPTCYSPVRHSSTPKGLSVRLACVKHAASVRPEPGSNSPNKNPRPNEAEFESEQSDLTTRHQKLASKTTTPLNGKKRHGKKQQQTKTTKHTIEFSNNTPARPRKLARGYWPLVSSADGQEPTEVGLPSGTPSRSAGWPRRDDESTSYVRENSESNGLMGRVFRFRSHRAHADVRRLRPLIQRARRRQYSACRAAVPASGRAGSPPAAAPTPRCRSARC